MVSDMKTFAYKGFKIGAPKKVSFVGEFCLPSMILWLLVLLSAFVERCFASRMWDLKKNEISSIFSF